MLCIKHVNLLFNELAGVGIEVSESLFRTVEVANIAACVEDYLELAGSIGGDEMDGTVRGDEGEGGEKGEEEG